MAINYLQLKIQNLHLLKQYKNTFMKRFFIINLFFSMVIWGCRHTKTITEITLESIPVVPSETLTPDTSIVNMIAPYKLIVDKEMTKKIAFTEFAIEKGIPDGSLNQLIADLILYASNKYASENHMDSVDIALLNHGGLRKSLPKGDITTGNVYELMPFDNAIAIVTLSGETMNELFQFLASKNEGHPIANCSFTISNKIATDIRINNKPIDLKKTYRVATNDYLISGNDGMIFFTKALKTEVISILVRDAIIQNISHFDLNAYKSGLSPNRIKLND